MKRYMFAIFLLSIFFTSGLTMTAHAAETVASGSCGSSVNWVLTDDGTLTISGVGPMNGFIIGKQPWYDYRDQISTVVVGSGVTSIGNYSFYSLFDNISYVKIADTVTSIGDYAFYHCNGFSYIRLPDSLLSIGSFAFGGTSLVSVTLPDLVSSIGAGAFNNCRKLISVVSLNPEPPLAGSYMFDNFEVLSRIMVPSGSADSYKSASGWSPYAGFIQDGSIGVQTFSVSTSFNGQTIYLDQADTVDLYIMASGVSGTVSVDWYMGTTLVHSQDDLGFFDPTTAIGAWRYTPGGDSTRVFYAVVTHTLNGVSESVTTDFVKIVVGSGDGSGSGDDVNDRLDQIDVELTEVKGAISDVSDKVDGLSDAVEQLPGQITDGMQQVQDQEKVEADSQGKDAVDQIIDVIPDESENFILALGSLVNVLSYEGTSAVITMPAMTIPAVSNLFPEIELLEEQDIDLEYYINMLPQWLLVLCRAFFDAAIVLYCIREFLGLIGDFANGFGRVNDGLGVSFDE